jgi:FG-GAP repeat
VELDHEGWSLSGKGDWDNDGQNDILAGATYGWESVNPHFEPGAAVLRLTGSTTECQETPFLRINGSVDTIGEGECFGYSVAWLGQVDSDSRDDFAVGAPRSSSLAAPLNERGRVYVFLSTKCGFTTTGGTVAANCANLIIEGEGIGDRFGHSIDYAGDFDGDGLPDLVVGAPGGPKSLAFQPLFPGAVYLIPGSSILASAADSNCSGGPPIISVEQLTGVDIWTVSAGAMERFGYAVAFAGDIGDDSLGFTDIVVGAPQFLLSADGTTTTYSGPGYAKVLLGSPGKHAVRIDGEGVEDMFGSTVSGDVDLNSDGKRDVLVGAPQWDDPQVDNQDAGRAYAFAMLLEPEFTAIAVHQGQNAGEYFGFNVAALGALGGPGDSAHYFAVCSRKFGIEPVENGCQDNCFAADTWAGGRVCGRAMVFRGVEAAYCFQVIGEDLKDSVGWAISIIGDLNDPNDPSDAPEFLLSACRWGPTGVLAERGRIYVFLR